MNYMLIDLNQVLISNLMQHLKMITKEQTMSEDLIRHMCINTIRSNVRQFRSKYPNVVLCCDSKHYWRREAFAFYKSQRKHDREASGLDWGMIFDVLNRIRDELRDNFPYKTLNIEGAEADDVIAVLTARLSAHGNVLILSSDKDFGQLQKYPNVTQYSPILKRFIKIDNPTQFIREHILKGDRGDGIPNFLSADNTFVIGERQKSINKNKMLEWLKLDPSQFCTTETMRRGYSRNKMLVDLDCVPDELKTRIVESYETTKPSTRMNMLNYLMQNKLKALVEVADEF